jgi:hydroxyquinol 1,2-dioxygenase
MRELTPESIADAVLERTATTSDPRLKKVMAAADCPIPGLPSIRFDLRLSREGEADKASGRVGSDPSAILKETAAPAPAAS